MSILGNFFALYIAGQRVAMATANNVSFKTDFVDITNKDSGLFGQSKPVKKMMSADIEAFHTSSIGNLVQFPEDFTQSVWVKDTGVTVSGTRIVGPTGQKLAQRITFGAGTYVIQKVTIVEDDEHTASLWVAGSGTINLHLVWESPILDVTLPITLTSTFTRIQLPTGASIDNTGPLSVYIEKGTATEVELFGPQVNVGATATDYCGSTKLFSDLAAAQDAGTALAIRHSTDLDADWQLVGNAYISALNTKTQANGVNTFTAQLTGTATQTVSNV